MIEDDIKQRSVSELKTSRQRLATLKNTITDTLEPSDRYYLERAFALLDIELQSIADFIEAL